MKYSTRLSDAVHILVIIAINPVGDMSSAAIAESVATNPGFIRQLMSLLRKGNIIRSTAGHAKPELAADPSEISLFDIYKAVEGDKPLLHLNTHTNPACGAGMNIQRSLQTFYDEFQTAAEEYLKGIKLSYIIERFHEMSRNEYLSMYLPEIDEEDTEKQ